MVIARKGLKGLLETSRKVYKSSIITLGNFFLGTLL